MEEPMFEVHPRRPEDRQRAKILQGIINQPYFQKRVIEQVEAYLADVIVPQILFGTKEGELKWPKNNQK